MNNRTSKFPAKVASFAFVPEFISLLGVLTSLVLAQPAMAGGGTDLDGDGKADLVWRNSSDGSTAIWLMNGTAIASSGFPGGVPQVWQITGIGDVNGDGKADVIWRHSISGTIAVWLMNGLSITSVGFPGSTSTDWTIQAVGDVNGDGQADLVWRNTNSGVVAIWLMNGATIASSGFLGGVPAAWQIAGIGDVTGDGKADIIWRNSTSGTVAVWLMNGLTITSVGFPGSASMDFQIAGVGDVDGDGQTDLVWRNTNSGAVALWLLNGTAIASTGFLTGLPSEWQIAQVGDTDGNGKADIIWRNSISGVVAVWLMNGLSISSDGSPGSTSTDWVITGGSTQPKLPNTFSLTINSLGTGTGTVTCNGTLCDPNYPAGTPLTLMVNPSVTSIFEGWGGVCAAAGTADTCNFTINANSNVTATFNLPMLSVVLSGNGTVTSNPAGIDCGTTCTASFDNGTSVTLTATGAGFSGWTGGGCSGTIACIITLNQNTTVTAAFNPSGLPCPAEPALVKDVWPGLANSFSISGNALINVNGTLFFRARDDVQGFELWKSDGTEAGTLLVKDIGPGNNTARQLIPQLLTNLNGTLFFIMDDGIHGLELWKSDGTEGGTVLVKDINPGSNSAFSRLITDSLVAVNNTLFFTANDGVNGVEVWKSDGTEGGTVMVKDIRAGDNGSAPTRLTDVNGTLFFVAGDGTHGLWKSDGTEAGTIKLATFNRYPEWLTNVNGILFFSALKGTNDELWKSNGTIAGTVMVKELNSVPRWLTNVNGTLFFTAVAGPNVFGLFKSDGTSMGTVLVKEVSNAVDLTRVEDKLYFRASTPSVGFQPYISDGTEAGTKPLRADLFVFNLSREGPWFTDVNGVAFFSAFDGMTGTELWKSDGTEAGTVLVKDIFPGGNSAPQSLTNVNGTLFFVATTLGVGRELWIACGSP
jgi:ELWxxDGT repeat protein